MAISIGEIEMQRLLAWGMLTVILMSITLNFIGLMINVITSFKRWWLRKRKLATITQRKYSLTEKELLSFKDAITGTY